MDASHCAILHTPDAYTHIYDTGDAASYRQQRAGRYSAAAFWAEMADPSRGARFPPLSSDTGEAMAAVADAYGEEDPPPTQEFGREELRYRVALVCVRWA